MKMTRIELCPLLDDFNIQSLFLRKMRDYLFDCIPTLPRKCPILPAEFRYENVTIVSPEIIEKFKSLFTFVTPTILGYPPNGVYRMMIKVYSPQDPTGWMLWIHAEVNVRLNDDRF